jgi:LPXTG-site transpeptidase (sortase) family protein
VIPLEPHRHRALYDDAGNIILPDDTSASTPAPDAPVPCTATEQISVQPKEPVTWEYIEEQCKAQRAPMQDTVRQMITLLLQEGAHQYDVSLRSAGKTLCSSTKDARHGIAHLWEFLLQPVWIPRRNREPKQLSRLTLFTLDTVRFGTTFAVIFTGLFVSLNYQSFWDIVTTNLNPIDHVRTIQALSASVDANLKDKLLKSPSLATAGSQAGDLLSYLPDVGPPENRLIIPKLGLNVPLVTPSYDALLREDWNQVEQDIQQALQMGVVHYPGTAKPGQAGNFFVTGHSSYYPWAAGQYKTVFARLHELAAGDEYWVYYGGDKHRYIVRGKTEVKPANVAVLDQPVDKRLSTLMTCTPIGTTLRRLIISAEEVNPQTGVALGVGEKTRSTLPKTLPQALPI